MGKIILWILAALLGLCLLYVLFLNSDCTLFGQLHRLDLIIGQVISMFVVNFLTYFQLCLIVNAMIPVGPMLLLLLTEIVVAVVLIYVYTELYYKLYAPHDMLLVYGNKRGIGLKIKMDSRRDKYNVSKLMSIDEGLEAGLDSCVGGGMSAKGSGPMTGPLRELVSACERCVTCCACARALILPLRR